VEVHLKPEFQARVDPAAKENNSGPAEYVQQLVEHYVDHDVWFREQVKKPYRAFARSVARPTRWKRLASISLAVRTIIAMVVPPLA
jgi:hypothetical protein